MQSPRGLILRRRGSNIASKLLGTAATLFGLSWLVWILIVTLLNGARALSPYSRRSHHRQGPAAAWPMRWSAAR